MTQSLSPRTHEVLVRVADPAAGERKPAHDRERATTRGLWWALVVAVWALLGLRLPATSRELAAAMPSSATAEIGDPQMVELALRVGTYLGVVLFAVVVLINVSLAAFAERRLRRPHLSVGRARIGVLFLVSAAALVPLQLVAWRLGHSLDKSTAAYLGYLAAVVCLIPLAVHRIARRTSAGDLATSIVTAAAVVLLACAL